jgi:hypothetical protein
MSCASGLCGSCSSRSVRSRTLPVIWACIRRRCVLWVRQAEADSGRRRDLLSSEEREELKRLRRENVELRRRTRP